MPDQTISGASLTDFLHQLADGVAGGCLHVGSGPQAGRIFLRGGQVYAVLVPGRRPELGTRLLTAGALSPETLAEVTEAQRTVFPSWSVPDLLVHHGHVERALIDAVISEAMHQAMTELLGWGVTTWRFRVNERTREHVAPPLTVAGLLAEVGRRQVAWQAIERAIVGVHAEPVSHAVPVTVAAAAPADLALHPGARTLLALVDGTLTVGELAYRCGFTLFEAGQVVFALLRAHLIEIPAGAPVPALSVDVPPATAVAGPLTRAFHALTALLGPAPTGEELFAVAVRPQGAPTVSAAKQRAADVLAEQAEREQAEREQAGRPEPVDPEAHAAVFAELRAAAEAERPQPLAQPVADQPSADQPVGVTAPPEPYRPSDTDTASLFRELSSLGLEEDDAPDLSRPPAPRAGAAAADAAAAARKRKGRFGRT